MEDVEPPSISSRCQVQLELKHNHKQWPSTKAMDLLHKLDQDRKFLFDSDKRRKYGYDKDLGFMSACNWEYEYIEVEEPEYTPSTLAIKYNFILSLYPFPVQLIKILRSKGWTVTGRHRMGRESPTTHKIEWGPWDYQLHEAPTRAALLADLEQLDKDTAKLDREISECQALLEIMPILPLPSTREEKRASLSRTFADFRRRLHDLVYQNATLFHPNGGGGYVRNLIRALRAMQLNPDVQLQDQVTYMFITFIFCCQCVFEIEIANDIIRIPPDDVRDIMPKEPFLSQFRERFRTDTDFKADWMLITSTIWISMQYMDIEPTNSYFMELYPFHDLRNDVNAFIATLESKKTKLQARRVEANRNLAHLHPATVGRAHHHAPPDGAGPSMKRKRDPLLEMATLLDRWVIG